MKDLYLDINMHITKDNKPSKYLNRIYDSLNIYPFDMLYNLRKTPQSKKHHPEGDVWHHTMLVVDEAAKLKYQSKNHTVFMWTALLHDIGKPSTTKIIKDRITSYNHDKVGAKLAKEFLKNFTANEDFINDVTNLVLYHMHILYVVNNLPFADVKGLIQKTDVREVALIGLCDRLGRGIANKPKEEENIKIFIQKLKRSREGLPV